MNEAPKRLLVVDDDSVDRQTVIRLLESRYTVVQAKNAAEAITTAGTFRPDCILVDYRLPDMDGVDLVRELAETKAAMVMLTGGGDETVAVESMKAGAHDYITKDSLEASRLENTILKAFERSRLEQRLEETRRELEEFVAITSHDLRSPLATIVGYLQVVIESAGETLPAQESEFVSRSRDLAGGLIEMIDQLIRYTKTGRTASQFADVDLQAAAHLALDRLQDLISSSGGMVQIEGLPVVSGVQNDLVQLLQNLIANALKFHDDKSPIVRVFAESSGNQEWVVSVEDNGIGISAEHRESIFAPLRRLHTESEFAGHGLGLATCRKIVQQHGGKIWVDEAESGGCLFRFSIPPA